MPNRYRTTPPHVESGGDNGEKTRYAASMDLITTTADLAAVCDRLARHPFVTVDTEFLRETTYYPQLCVLQIASTEESAVIDALAEGLDLAPFFALMAAIQHHWMNRGRGWAGFWLITAIHVAANAIALLAMALLGSGAA